MKIYYNISGLGNFYSGIVQCNYGDIVHFLASDSPNNFTDVTAFFTIKLKKNATVNSPNMEE